MTTFYRTAFWTPTFHTFLRFWGNLGPKRMPKGSHKGPNKGCKSHMFLIDSHKVPKVGPAGGQGLQKDVQMEPRGTKMEPQGLLNGGFGVKNVVKRGREFRPFRRSTPRTTQENVESQSLLTGGFGMKKGAKLRREFRPVCRSTPHNTKQNYI